MDTYEPQSNVINPSGLARVRFSDGSLSGGLSFNYRSNTGNDFYLGFAAPENLGIETLFLDFDLFSGATSQFNGGFIDDLSFVTATAVPEPTTALTFAAFGLIATGFRRRRLRRV